MRQAVKYMVCRDMSVSEGTQGFAGTENRGIRDSVWFRAQEVQSSGSSEQGRTVVQKREGIYYEEA